MKAVKLSQVAVINPRLTQEERERLSGEVTFLPMDAVSESGCISYQKTRPVDELFKGFTPFKRGDVILAKITPCMENGKAAHLCELKSDYGFGSTEFHVIRPSPMLDARYLFHQIWNPRFRHLAASKMSGAVGQKRVPAEFLRQLPIPLPPIEEQRRISAILDKADGIRRKRDQALALAEEFLRSAFLQMFGDPVANPKAWPIIELGECIDEIRYGTSTKCGDEKDGDLPVLRIPNIAAGEVNWKDLKYTTLSAAETERLMMKKGDLIFVRTNGNPEYIGRCAVFDENRRALFASYLIRARFSQRSKLTARYAWMALTIPSYRQLLLRETKTTAGNYNISASGLKSLKIPCAPLDLQRKFARLYDEWREAKAKIRRDLNGASTLVASLSQRAFRGEL